MEKDNNEKKHILGRVQVTRECNQHCVFCAAPPADKELSLAEIKEKIKELKGLGTTDVMLTGGEPTLREDLLEILEFCRELEFPEITIQTNGYLLHDAGLLKGIKETTNVKFNVSLHTCNPETFGKISTKPEHFKGLISGLRNIGRMGMWAYPTIVISSLNFRELPELVEFINDNFDYMTHLSFNYIDPTCRAKENPWTVPRYSETEIYIHKAVALMKEYRMSFRIERLPLCYMAGFEEYSSDIRRPVFNEKRIMSHLKTEHDSIRENIHVEVESNFMHAGQCRACWLSNICPGINPNYTEIHGTGELYPVFTDPEKIIERVRASRIYVNPEERLRKRISRDLELFRHAIKKKSNLNNIYDTYSYFLTFKEGVKDEGFIIQSWKKHIEKIKEGAVPNLLSFYIHVPYCVSNCSYCCYPSKTLRDKKQLSAYIAFLKKQINTFSGIFKEVDFKNLYIGGGTPSIFSEKQLDGLLKSLFKHFKFHDYSERSMEMNPRNTTEAKLAILEKYGFNKISYGVQTLSDRILKINERGYQKRESVIKAIESFNIYDLNYLNVDLILGLKGDTIGEFLESFEELCRMEPSNICIYPVKTNENYVFNNYGSIEKFEQFYYPLFDGVSEKVYDIAKKHGYSALFESEIKSYIRPIIFSKNENGPRRRVEFSYAHFSQLPYSNFCLGYYSHSRITDEIDYRFIDRNKIDSMFLKEFSSDPNDYIYLVDRFSPKFERVKFIVQEFYKHRKIPMDKYRSYYGTDVTEDFAYAISALERLGLVHVSKNYVNFKNIDEKTAYPYLLFFAGRKNVLAKL